MGVLAARLRIVIGVMALLGFAPFTYPAGAQQAQSVNPTKSAVNEQQLLRQLKTIEGRGSIPDKKSYKLEQPAEARVPSRVES